MSNAIFEGGQVGVELELLMKKIDPEKVNQEVYDLIVQNGSDWVKIGRSVFDMFPPKAILHEGLKKSTLVYYVIRK